MASATFVDALLREPKGQLFVRVNDAFIASESSKSDVMKIVRDAAQACQILLSPLSPSTKEKDMDTARLLYSVIHRKYLLTDEGRQAMIKRRDEGAFPPCRRTLCDKCRCFPIGLSEGISEGSVKMFCPNCTDVYTWTGSEIDGGFFGKEWIHRLIEKCPSVTPTTPAEAYEPRVFGFRVSQRQGPLK